MMLIEYQTQLIPMHRDVFLPQMMSGLLVPKQEAGNTLVGINGCHVM